MGYGIKIAGHKFAVSSQRVEAPALAIASLLVVYIHLYFL